MKNREALQAPEGFVGKAEVARRTGKSIRTIDSWMRDGLVPFIKLNRCVLFRWADVEQHIVANFQIIRPHKTGRTNAKFQPRSIEKIMKPTITP
ncbi:MAG: hypothetical protein WAO21_02130 [Verrucomicrobiia bacterium]